MGGGSILKMLKKVYKDDPEAISAINETLSKSKKAKDTSEADKRKIKKLQPNSEPKKTVRDDSSITEEDKQKKRAELDERASNKKNEPEKELLQITSSLTKIENKVRQVAKDDSEVNSKKIDTDILSVVNRVKDQKISKDDSVESSCLINGYIDGECIFDSKYYYGNIKESLLVDFVKNNIWDKKYGNFDGYDMEISMDRR